MSADAFQRPPGSDPHGEAEKQLRASLGREARETRETLEKVKYAGYGCLVLVALGIILAFLL
ncbi:MAG: hypothetical protein ACRELS_14710 [Candidatus Rokuibacteriota bacterium]